MIGNDWDKVLEVVENSVGFKKFLQMINEKYNTSTVYPPMVFLSVFKKVLKYHHHYKIFIKN